ncbi:MAG: hypothetical protein K2L12_00495, partial [Clostridia bacterium]|nr:hypothetical protein [Clostridia bacterium]
SILCVLLLTLILCVFTVNEISYADENIYINEEELSNSSDKVEPYGIYTSISLSISGGNGKVWVTAINDITIFPSTVYVVIQLYSSYEYTEDYNKMSLISTNSILDLDMGKSLIVEASTQNEEKFWIGRMRYKVDNGDWKEKTVGPAHYSANGEFIGIT